MDYQFTIIVPVYNEEGNLKRLENSLSSYIKTAPISTCVLLINDGSRDNSQQLIEQICKQNEAFNYITLKNNEGLSSALKAGFDHVKTEFTGYIDADLQTNPEDFNLLLAHREQYDLIIGMRTDRKDSFIKNKSSRMANRIRHVFTNDGIDDTGCPLKVINTNIAKHIPFFKGLHRFLPAMVLLQHGTVLQIPVRHYERIEGQSKFGIRNRLIRSLIDCFAFLWMKKRYINYTISKQS